MITLEKAHKLRAIMEKTCQFLDYADALDALELFPCWEHGKQYEPNSRFRYGENIFRVLQAHTSQPNWPPDQVPSLYAVISPPEKGYTKETPILYAGNMALEADRFYTQDGIIYQCFRSTGIPVYDALSALVHLYVERVS